MNKELYSKEGIYSDFTYGSPLVNRGLKHAISLCQGLSMKIPKKAKILVVGAGNGYELVQFLQAGHEAKGVEIYIPEIPIIQENTIIANARKMPFEDKQFDLVFCCEMMEHIDSLDVDPILRECKRVADLFYFTIATRGDAPYNTHITIKPGWRWVKKFEKLGFTVAHAQICPRVKILFGQRNFFFYEMCHIDGVMVYGKC